MKAKRTATAADLENTVEKKSKKRSKVGSQKPVAKKGLLKSYTHKEFNNLPLEEQSKLLDLANGFLKQVSKGYKFWESEDAYIRWSDYKENVQVYGTKKVLEEGTGKPLPKKYHTLPAGLVKVISYTAWGRLSDEDRTSERKKYYIVTGFAGIWNELWESEEAYHKSKTTGKSLKALEAAYWTDEQIKLMPITVNKVEILQTKEEDLINNTITDWREIYEKGVKQTALTIGYTALTRFWRPGTFNKKDKEKGYVFRDAKEIVKGFTLRSLITHPDFPFPLTNFYEMVETAWQDLLFRTIGVNTDHMKYSMLIKLTKVKNALGKYWPVGDPEKDKWNPKLKFVEAVKNYPKEHDGKEMTVAQFSALIDDYFKRGHTPPTEIESFIKYAKAVTSSFDKAKPKLLEAERIDDPKMIKALDDWAAKLNEMNKFLEQLGPRIVRTSEQNHLSTPEQARNIN
jgi:hypothetical protein